MIIEGQSGVLLIYQARPNNVLGGGGGEVHVGNDHSTKRV